MSRRLVTLFRGRCDAGLARLVRRRLAALAEFRMPPTLVADCQLIATELITNAVNARATWVEVEVLDVDGQVELRVRDDAAGIPQQRDEDATASSGRGLRIVQGLSDAWGFRSEPLRGKTVWASMSMPSAPSG